MKHKKKHVKFPYLLFSSAITTLNQQQKKEFINLN